MPPNEASLTFRASRGYIDVGRLEHAARKVMALLSKELAAPAPRPPVRLPR